MICHDCLKRIMLCKCGPWFLVWRPEGGGTEGDATRVYAIEHVEAAKEWAEESDDNPDDPGWLSNGGQAVVFVKRDGGHYIMRLVVGFEMTPTFYARPAGGPRCSE